MPAATLRLRNHQRMTVNVPWTVGNLRMMWLAIVHLFCLAVFLELVERAPIIDDMD